MKLKKMDNRGFSLVELLVAVAILAVIVTPLLHSFVTSAHLSKRSRELSDTSLVAKNIAETFDAIDVSNWGTIDFPDASPVPSAVLPTGYEFGYKGFADGKYDAYVTIGTEHEANHREMTTYTPIDAVFNQAIPGDGQLEPDTMAATEMALEASAISGEDVLDTTVKNAMDRVITITVDEAAGEDLASYSAVFSYSYSFTYQNDQDELVPGKVETTCEYPNFCSCSLVEDGEAVQKLKSLYVFFTPRSDYDKIVIYHLNGRTMLDVFLVSQGNTSAMHTLIESRNKNSTFYSNEITNVLWNMVNSVTYQYYKGEVWFNTPSTASASLVKTEQQNRIYDVTVDIFANGDTANKLYTLKTTTIG